ncbi:hypothetical protein [Aquabacter cavernae]|uniref:hypothetical protein n=1 Tax=Aquabacter cavernae TaxID=2496029 RepID=UPI000F8F72C9|nr:hypothetical protein [Aquabacter cavernae]
MCCRARGDGSAFWSAPIARGGKCLAAPTLLFEAASVRWAGTVMEGEGTARALVDRYVGYPRAVLDMAEPDEVAAGAVQCCMLPRAVFEAVGDATVWDRLRAGIRAPQDHLSFARAHLDLYRRLREQRRPPAEASPEAAVVRTA